MSLNKLKDFWCMNYNGDPAHMNKVDESVLLVSQIKTKQRYIWTKREFTEEGATLGELVDQVSPLTLQTSGSPDFSGSDYLFVFMWLISPSERFLSVCCIFICYLFFPSAPPISPQGSLKFHLSPCQCLVVINSRWTEHDDGSAQYFCTIHTDKGGKEQEIYVQHFEFCLHLQSAILLLYISQIICSIILKTFETLDITAGVTVS